MPQESRDSGIAMSYQDDEDHQPSIGRAKTRPRIRRASPRPRSPIYEEPYGRGAPRSTGQSLYGRYGTPYSSYSQGRGQMMPYGVSPFIPPGGTQGERFFGGQNSYYGGGYGPYGVPNHLLQPYEYGPLPPASTEVHGPVRTFRRLHQREGADQEILTQGLSDAVWDPGSKRDMTIHLELEVEEEVDNRIADVAFLKRMGRFREAHEYFRANLADHLQNSVPVMAEYAGMLLEQGYFGRIFESFDVEAITISYLATPTNELSAEQVNLVLLLQLARSYSDPDLRMALNIAQKASEFLQTGQPRNSHDRIDSAELHVLCQYLKLTRYIRVNSNMQVRTGRFDFHLGWQQWVSLYRNLMDESRHWDLRDTVDAFVSAFGSRNMFSSLLGEDSVEAGITKLFDDWGRTMPTETSDLCLLDILACVCRECVVMEDDDSDPTGLVNFIADRARVVASSAKKNNEQSVKWRPYLEWILVEEARVRIRKSVRGGRAIEANSAPGLTSRFFQGLPGWTIWLGALPVYAPDASENPGWPTLEDEKELSDGLLRVVLNVSEELGNFSVQASILRELICRSQDPRSLLAKLDHLHLSLMGDKLGALRTRLSKYLLAVDDESRRLLKEELVDLDPTLHRWRNFAHPLAQWCHLRVMHALMLSTGSSSEELRNADNLAKALESQLPEHFLAKLNGPLPTAPRLVALPASGSVRMNLGDEDAPAMEDERERLDKKKVTIKENISDESISSGSSLPAGDPVATSIPVDPFIYQTYDPASPPPPASPEDSEVEAMKNKLELLETQRKREEEEYKQRELEERIRREAVDALERRMEGMRKAQEEAKKELERAKEEGFRAAIETMKAEQEAEKARIEAEREAEAATEAKIASAVAAAIARTKAEMMSAINS